MTAMVVYCRVESRNLSISSLPSKVSSIKGRLPSKVVIYPRSSSIKVVFHQWLSPIKGHLSINVVFHQRLSSIKGQNILECSNITHCSRNLSILDRKKFWWGFWPSCCYSSSCDRGKTKSTPSPWDGSLMIYHSQC